VANNGGDRESSRPMVSSGGATMPIEFSTNTTLSDRRPLYTDEDWERFVEALHPRFTTLWFSDHPQYDVLEAWTSMCYVAARLPRFKVGTLVLCQAYRNPGLLAKMAATLQKLSQGRLVLGVGAGWLEEDFNAYGYDFERPGVRVAQLAETIELLRAMWTTNPATYRGQHRQVEAADSWPLPDPMIPIMVGTNGRKALRVTAQLADIWTWDMCETFADLLSTLRRACVEFGRPEDAVKAYVETELDFPDDPADFVPAEDQQLYPGFGRNQHLGPTPKAAIEQMKPYRDLGVDHFIVTGNIDALRLFSNEVAPYFD
jgi:alkanesulfonate monooxygenase SsuD/methylene tetrahydromethanopterin reductase-like flavin-dependent oxidoreductase (luciferase family)